MHFNINGLTVTADVDVRTSLLDLLREHLSLTGSKKGCNQGACGACTVLVDGERINSCLALAVQYEGRRITTVEGLATGEQLHPLQRAFVEHDGFQCGYCTPGQICSAIAMADELARGIPSHVTQDLTAVDIAMTTDELRERMSGNLCRCGAYNGIAQAIEATLGTGGGEGGDGMTPFTYSRATDAADAIRAGAIEGARYLGGGTNLVDLMREGVEHPSALVDVTHLSQSIEDTPDGGLTIGAATKNTALAADARVRERYPVLSRALLAGASAQIRNMATVAGNILQRTRCTYFYDQATACNKRSPGNGCDAREGFNRYHAILGASTACVATHPSDMCVALAALDAVVHLQGPRGARAVPLEALHRLPGDTPERDTDLEPGELITAITLPPLPWAKNSTYRKVRDRSSYAFALISVAAALRVGADGSIEDVRIALGGVAHKPWRATRAESALRGAGADTAAFAAAAEAELAHAAPLRHNAFKTELARRTIVAVLATLHGEQS